MGDQTKHRIPLSQFWWRGELYILSVPIACLSLATRFYIMRSITVLTYCTLIISQTTATKDPMDELRAVIHLTKSFPGWLVQSLHVFFFSLEDK